MKKALISLLCLVVLAAFYACSNTGNEDLKGSGGSGQVRFERISQEAFSSDLNGKIDKSRAEAGYEQFTVGNDNYIAVYSGQRPTAGYSIEIISIAAEEGKTSVTVKETSPAEGDMTAQALTYPFDLAKLESPISGGVEIEFVKGSTN